MLNKTQKQTIETIKQIKKLSDLFFYAEKDTAVAYELLNIQTQLKKIMKDKWGFSSEEELLKKCRFDPIKNIDGQLSKRCLVFDNKKCSECDLLGV